MKGMTTEELEKYYLAENGQKISLDNLKYIAKDNQQYDVKGINDVALYHEIITTVEVLGL